MTTCPDDQTLAALVDGQLTDASRHETVLHVDTCAICFDRVATIAAAADATPFVSPQLLKAGAGVSAGRRPWRVLMPAGAVAAGLLLAVAVWRAPSPELGSDGPASLDPVRSRGASVVAPVVEAPRDDEPQDAGFAVRWQSPDAAVFSEVKLTTADGDVIWSTEVQGATSQVAVPVAPPANATAYLWVTAHLPEGRTVSSNVVRVRGATRP